MVCAHHQLVIPDHHQHQPSTQFIHFLFTIPLSGFPYSYLLSFSSCLMKAGVDHSEHRYEDQKSSQHGSRPLSWPFHKEYFYFSICFIFSLLIKVRRNLFFISFLNNYFSKSFSILICELSLKVLTIHDYYCMPAQQFLVLYSYALSPGNSYYIYKITKMEKLKLKLNRSNSEIK